MDILYFDHTSSEFMPQSGACTIEAPWDSSFSTRQFTSPTLLFVHLNDDEEIKDGMKENYGGKRNIAVFIFSRGGYLSLRKFRETPCNFGFVRRPIEDFFAALMSNLGARFLAEFQVAGVADMTLIETLLSPVTPQYTIAESLLEAAGLAVPDDIAGLAEAERAGFGREEVIDAYLKSPND